MSAANKVLIYGASSYTGKFIAAWSGTREIPFVFAGRTREHLESALKIVEQ